MTSSVRVSTAALVEALRSADLLATDAPHVPEYLDGLTDDSRRVVRGGAFMAVRGHSADGTGFVRVAIEAGAVLLFAEDVSVVLLAAGSVPVVGVRDARKAAAVLAATFYGRPADDLRLIGVTGTNGKTTTVHLLRALLSSTGIWCASVGTLGVLVGAQGEAVNGGQGLTTPGPVEMQRVLRDLVDRGVRAVAIEVSSHALDQSRVAGLAFDVAVFTSFSRDHLDYHGTMAAYFAAKAKLIAMLKPDGVAVVNGAEPAWGALPKAPRTLTFVTDLSDAPDAATTLARSSATVRAESVQFSASGSQFTVRARDGSAGGLRAETRIPLLGDFNVTNATGAVAAAWALGCSLDSLAAALPGLPQVPGRLERLLAHPTVLRDYAHTPDALDRALRAVRPFACTPEGEPTRVVAVFGCGGDRDRGKRPEMGAIAQQQADVVILTSDNPRTENPERILDDIEAGMNAGSDIGADSAGAPNSATSSAPNSASSSASSSASDSATNTVVHRARHVRIEDRREAIAHALRIAGPHDVVLLAGKGHETYQVRGTEKLHFDEAEIVAELSKSLGGLT